jgi:aminoglycoside phosphotransferase (APT) family kinase protein
VLAVVLREKRAQRLTDPACVQEVCGRGRAAAHEPASPQPIRERRRARELVAFLVDLEGVDERADELEVPRRGSTGRHNLL